MATVYAELSISLDGYMAGPNVSADLPMGEGGELVHAWMFEGRTEPEQARFEADYFSQVGALIMGRRMADVGIGPWGEDPTFHAPCFVVTHRPHDTITKLGGTSYVFVTDDIRTVLERAKAAAGAQDVLVNGGADITRQFLEAGLLDQLRLHVVPILLGGGSSLLDGVSPEVSFTAVEASTGPRVTHLTYDVG